MKRYDISIEIIRVENYPVEAESWEDATTKALEAAIAKHPGADVWVRGWHKDGKQ